MSCSPTRATHPCWSDSSTSPRPRVRTSPAGRGGPARVGHRLRGRRGRGLPDDGVASLRWRGAARPGERRRPGGVHRHLGGARCPRLARRAGGQDRPLGPGTRTAPGARDARRARWHALDPDTEGGMHAITETWKLAMADREAWFGDSSPVTVEDLLATGLRRGTRCSGERSCRPRPASRFPRRVARPGSPSTYAVCSPASRPAAPPTSPRVSPPSAATGPPRATPATSTSSTAGAT